MLDHQLIKKHLLVNQKKKLGLVAKVHWHVVVSKVITVVVDKLAFIIDFVGLVRWLRKEHEH